MNYGLVLEGGAMRGLFSAGVIDVLMEHDIGFDSIAGVSAGAAFGCNYKSKQPGRVIRYNMRYADDKRFCSVSSLIKTGDMFGAEFCYDTIPNKLDVFDKKTYDNNPVKFYAVCTDAETGEPVYTLLEKADDLSFRWIRASASMPLVSKPVLIEGRHYIDGGITDSIPLEFMMKSGCEKNIVVLTQTRDYSKEKASMLPLMKLSLRKFPKTYEAIKRRHIMYNRTRDMIFEEERSGNALIICPEEKLPIGRIEHDPEVMKKAYEIGRKTAESRLEELKAFMNI